MFCAKRVLQQAMRLALVVAVAGSASMAFAQYEEAAAQQASDDAHHGESEGHGESHPTSSPVG